MDRRQKLGILGENALKASKRVRINIGNRKDRKTRTKDIEKLKRAGKGKQKNEEIAAKKASSNKIS